MAIFKQIPEEDAAELESSQDYHQTIDLSEDTPPQLNSANNRGVGIVSQHFIELDEPDDGELVPVIPMRYRHFRIKIFKQQSRRVARYFYEPVLLLDPSKIQSQVNKATGQAYVRFLVQMWNEAVEAQVLDWIKSLPGGANVQGFCVQAMPYDELRLVKSGDFDTSAVYRLPIQSTPYHQLDQSLQLHVLCETKEAADSLAEAFRADPSFSIQDLTLECTIFKSTTSAEPNRKKSRPESGSSKNIVRSFKYLRFNIDLSGGADYPQAQGILKDYVF